MTAGTLAAVDLAHRNGFRTESLQCQPEFSEFGRCVFEC